MYIKKIVYCGHSAIFLESDKFVIAIDPWLEGNPKCPDHLKNPTKLDYIILSHGHSDHAGDTVRLAKNFGAIVIATYELANILIQEGVPENQVVHMNKGGTFTIQNISLTLTQAFHSSSYDTSSGPLYAGEACGIIVKDGNHTIYHAGDTTLFSDISLIEQIHKPDLALLPIGDRFTMGPYEASLALAMLNSKVVIPIHYDTFELLTGTLEQFKEYCAKNPRTKEREIMALMPGQEHNFDLYQE